jgi:hypothetical protein
MPYRDYEHSCFRVLVRGVLRAQHRKAVYDRSPTAGIVVRESDRLKVGTRETLQRRSAQTAGSENNDLATALSERVESVPLTKAGCCSRLVEKSLDLALCALHEKAFSIP